MGKLNQKVNKRQHDRATPRHIHLEPPHDDAQVLSLTEYVEGQKTALIKDQYASTLPFDLSKISIRKAAAVLERTKGRWLWFSQAQDRDMDNSTALGTLGCLPPEIRHIIYQIVIDGIPGVTLSEIRHTPFEPCHVFKDDSLSRAIQKSWWYGPSANDNITLKIREASHTLQHELDHLVLPRINVQFNCGTAVTRFFSRVPSPRLETLRRIEFHLLHHKLWCREEYVYTELDFWLRAFRKVPRTALLSVSVVKFSVQVDRCFGVCEDGFPVWRCLKEPKRMLRIVADKVRQRAPEAEIGLLERGICCEGVRSVLRGALMLPGSGERH